LTGPSSVSVPNHYTLHLDSGRSDIPSSMGSLGVVTGSSLSNAQSVGSCPNLSSCDVDVPLSWADNNNPGVRKYWTVLQVAGTTYYSDELDVNVQKTPVGVSLQGPGAVIVPNGIALSATVDQNVPSSMYSLSILTGDSLQNARLAARCPNRAEQLPGDHSAELGRPEPDWNAALLGGARRARRPVRLKPVGC
jgi:hypothetical protein